MEDDFMVTVNDLHKLRGASHAPYCVPGLQSWFSSHGLDFQVFIREGMKASEVLALNDALGNELVELVREERARGQG